MFGIYLFQELSKEGFNLGEILEELSIPYNTPEGHEIAWGKGFRNIDEILNYESKVSYTIPNWRKCDGLNLNKRIVDSSLGLLEEFEIVEREDLLLKALEKLKEINNRDYEVIIKRFFEGKTWENTSEELGISSNSARQIEHRALNALYPICKRLGI